MHLKWHSRKLYWISLTFIYRTLLRWWPTYLLWLHIPLMELLQCFTGTSDHHPTKLSLIYSSPQSTWPRYNLLNANLSKFNTSSAAIEAFQVDSPHMANYDHFIHFIMSFADATIPKSTSVPRPRQVSWWTLEIKLHKFVHLQNITLLWFNVHSHNTYNRQSRSTLRDSICKFILTYLIAIIDLLTFINWCLSVILMIFSRVFIHYA